MICNQTIGDAVLYQVIGHVAAGAVNETADHVIVAVQLSNNPELSKIQKALSQCAADLFSDTTINSINHVIDLCCIRQRDMTQVADNIVIILRSLTVDCLALKFTVGTV